MALLHASSEHRVADMSLSRFRSLKAEEFLLLLVLLTFPFDKVFTLTQTVNVQQEGLSLSKFFTMLLFIVYFGRGLLQRSNEIIVHLLPRTPTKIFILCYIGFSILSVINGRSNERAFEFIFQRISLYIFYCLLIGNLKDRTFLQMAIFVFVLGSFFSSAAGCHEMATGKAIVQETKFTESEVREGLQTASTGQFRIQGLTTDPDDHSALLLIQMGLLMYFIYSARSWKWKAVGLLVLAMLILNVVAASSRGAWICMFVCLVFFLALVPMRRKLFMAMAVFIASMMIFASVILFFPSIPVLERITGKDKHGGRAFSYRANLLHLTWEMAQDHWLLGVGTGNFGSEYHRYTRVAPTLVKKLTPTPLNIYMAVLAENGIFGLLSFLLFLSSVFLALVKCMRIAPDLDSQVLALGLLTSFLAYLIDQNFFMMWDNKYGWAVMGFAGGFYRLMERERTGIPSNISLELKQRSPLGECRA